MTLKSFCIPAILLFLFTETACAQRDNNKYAPEVEERIARVENNLTAWVRLDSLRNWNIYERMNAFRVNGVTVAVIDNYNIDWVKSYGWADTLERRPVTNETLFQAASIGKSINGFAFAKLHQDKVVDLSKDIDTYLRSWSFPYDSISKGKHINLRNILSHSAGLTVHGYDGYKWNQQVPELLQILDGKSPANSPAVRSQTAPGLRFQYSGGGYEISELLLQDVTHQPYEEFITQKIFAPLGMKHSTYQLTPLPEMCATAYRYDGRDIGCKYHRYPEKACGAGLWTTATDLANFIVGIQSSLAGKSRILTMESVKFMLTPVLESSNSALGFFIEKKGDEKYFQHGGLNEGFSSQYYGSFEGGRGVVVLINSDHRGLMDEIVNSVATVYGWKEFYPFVNRKVVSVPDSVLDRYIGRYRFEGREEGPTISRKLGSLYLKDPGSPVPWEMYFTSETEFFMLEAWWANQKFVFDAKGRLEGFHILGDDYKAAVTKID